MIGEFQLSIFYTQMAKYITNLFDNLGSLTKGNQAIEVKRLLFSPMVLSVALGLRAS